MRGGYHHPCFMGEQVEVQGGKEPALSVIVRMLTQHRLPWEPKGRGDLVVPFATFWPWKLPLIDLVGL